MRKTSGTTSGTILLAALALLLGALQTVNAAERPVLNPAPTAKDWADIGKLPDWSGVWTPNISDQDRKAKTDMPPWNPKAMEQVNWMLAEEKAGRPPPIFVNCLPEAMPGWMLVSHNSMEVLMTPGRVTMLGESDGNRLRRVYTDGRPHPKDVEETFHGHSIGRWEGDTLVIDTVGVLPQAWLATAEHLGVPNNGDLHVAERIRVEGNYMRDEMTITAPNVLTKPWKTVRSYVRTRNRGHEITEGQCIQGNFAPKTDANGFQIFVPIPHEVGGNYPAPPKQR